MADTERKTGEGITWRRMTDEERARVPRAFWWLRVSIPREEPAPHVHGVDCGFGVGCDQGRTR